jgi:hypothetical protein
MDKIADVVKELAAQLGVGADKLWATLLAQAPLNAAYHHQWVVNANAGITIAVLLFLAALVFLFVADEFERGAAFGAAVFSLLLLTLCMSVRQSNVYWERTARENPAYYALDDLSSHLSK